MAVATYHPHNREDLGTLAAHHLGQRLSADAEGEAAPEERRC